MSDIRLARPYINFDDVKEEFRSVFDSGLFTRGENVESFRLAIAEYTGAKHAFLMTSATTSLWMCLKLLGVTSGDEIIISDFSFPATANAVEDLGAIPIFADVDLGTFNMLPSELEAKITNRTKAVIFVDALGNPSGLLKIKEICMKFGLPLIEDAACAIGSSENGFKCGSIADLTCFSFHPRKLISTGEGGAITTNRDDWAEWLSVKLFHGAKGSKGGGLDFVDYGYNFRLPELQAIMGNKQLKKIENIMSERNQIRDSYIRMLDLTEFAPQQLGPEVEYNVQSLVFTVPKRYLRDQLIFDLRQMGIETTIGTYAQSNATYYLKKYSTPMSNSIQLEKTTITLPCYSGVDVDRVVNSIKQALYKQKQQSE